MTANDGVLIISDANIIATRDGHVYRFHTQKRKWLKIVSVRKIAMNMLEVFVGSRPSSAHCALHKDDDRSNNAIENLYWGTKQQNAEDMYKNGKRENYKIAELEIEQNYIIELHQNGATLADLAAMYNVDPKTINKLIPIEQRRPSGRKPSNE